MDADDDLPMEEIVVYNPADDYSAFDAMLDKLNREEDKASPSGTPKKRGKRSATADRSTESVASRLRQDRDKTPPPAETPSSPIRSPSAGRSNRESTPVLFTDNKDFLLGFTVDEYEYEWEDGYQGSGTNNTPPPSKSSSPVPQSSAASERKVHWATKRKQEKLEKQKRRAEKKAAKKEGVKEEQTDGDDEGEGNISEGEMGSQRSERTKALRQSRFSPTPTATPRSPAKNVNAAGGEPEVQETPDVETNTPTVKKRRGRPPKKDPVDDEEERTEAPPTDAMETDAPLSGRKKIKRTKSLGLPVKRASSAAAVRGRRKISQVSGDVTTPGGEPGAKRTRLTADGPSTSTQPDDTVSRATQPKRGRGLNITQNAPDSTPSRLRARSMPSSRGRGGRRSVAIASTRRPATRSTDQSPVRPPSVNAMENREEKGVVKAPLRYEPPVRVTKEEAKKEILQIYDDIPPQFIRLFHHHVKGFANSLLEENPGLSPSRNNV